MSTYDVVIIGGGVMGAATASELARKRLRVALVDQAALPNPRGASVDHSKVFRFAYPDALYARLAMDGLELWREIEEETGARLLTETGVLLLGHNRPSFETDTFDVLRRLGVEAEMLASRDLAKRYPQFDARSFVYGVVDPSGAILHAESAVHTLIELARSRGVSVIETARVTGIEKSGNAIRVATEGGSSFESGRALVTAGPWTRRLLPQLSDLLKVTRQEVAYFEPLAADASSFEAKRFPIFIELETGFYGFPIHHSGAMKIANHHKGREVDPYSQDEPVSDQFIEQCRAFFRKFIPALAQAAVKETRVCLYNNTPDDDFIIDWHPELAGVLIATGFSGHGFKFGSVIGRIAAELLSEGNSSYELDRFRLDRF